MTDRSRAADSYSRPVEGRLALAATGLIAGCGGASISSGSGNASAGGGTPVRGGTFNVGSSVPALPSSSTPVR